MLGFDLIPNKEKMDEMTENSVLRAACPGVLHNAAFDCITSPWLQTTSLSQSELLLTWFLSHYVLLISLRTCLTWPIWLHCDFKQHQNDIPVHRPCKISSIDLSRATKKLFNDCQVAWQNELNPVHACDHSRYVWNRTRCKTIDMSNTQFFTCYNIF